MTNIATLEREVRRIKRNFVDNMERAQERGMVPDFKCDYCSDSGHIHAAWVDGRRKSVFPRVIHVRVSMCNYCDAWKAAWQSWFICRDMKCVDRNGFRSELNIGTMMCKNTKCKVAGAQGRHTRFFNEVHPTFEEREMSLLLVPYHGGVLKEDGNIVIKNFESGDETHVIHVSEIDENNPMIPRTLRALKGTI